MEHKNDIGDLLKDRFEHENKVPDQQVWDRINTSLDERDKNKARLVWYKYVGVALLLATIIGAVVLTSHTSEIKKAEENNTTSVDKITNNISTEPKKEKDTKDLLETTTNSKDETFFEIKNGIETSVTEKDSTYDLEKSVTKVKTKSKSSTNTNKADSQTDTYKVTTTYSYSMSVLDTTFTSQNKNELDRMVANAKRKLFVSDSLNSLKKNDTIIKE